MQPVSVHVKLIDVQAEVERHRRAHIYPRAIVKEAVLLQYSIDTFLDETLEKLFEVRRTQRVSWRAAKSQKAAG